MEAKAHTVENGPNKKRGSTVGKALVKETLRTPRSLKASVLIATRLDTVLRTVRVARVKATRKRKARQRGQI